MNTGSGRSMGKHPPNGLAPCSSYSAVTAAFMAWRSFLWVSCSRFSWGCSFCMTSMERVCLIDSGVRTIIIATVSMTMAMP